MSRAWSPASHAAHHRRMSSGEGGVRAFSMRLDFECVQPHRAASSPPVMPASARRARSRSATRSRAACAEDDGEVMPVVRLSGDLVLVVRYRPGPHRVEGIGAQLGHRRLLARLAAAGRPVAGEVVPADHAAVDQPEVVPGQGEIGRLTAGLSPLPLLGSIPMNRNDMSSLPDVWCAPMNATVSRSCSSVKTTAGRMPADGWSREHLCTSLAVVHVTSVASWPAAPRRSARAQPRTGGGHRAAEARVRAADIALPPEVIRHLTRPGRRTS